MPQKMTTGIVSDRFQSLKDNYCENLDSLPIISNRQAEKKPGYEQNCTKNCFGDRTIARDHHSKPSDMSDKLLVIVRLVNALCNSMEQNGTGSDPAEILAMPEARILNLTVPEIHELEMGILWLDFHKSL